MKYGKQGVVLVGLGVVSLATLVAYPFSFAQIKTSAVTQRPTPQKVQASPARTPGKRGPILPCPYTVDGGGGGDFLTIQAAVNALPNPGPCTVNVEAGTYNEAVAIASRNTLAASDAARIVIQADPAATPGTVIVTPPGGSPAFTFMNSKFITIKGFNITGATVESIVLSGGGSTNSDITIDSNDIHDNATSGTSSGGIGIGSGNDRTWVVNNLIRANGRNGIALGFGGSTSAGHPKYVVNNTIFGNGYNGITTPSQEDLFVINNLIVGNGTQAGTTGGRNGINSFNAANPASQRLLNNMFYKNGNVSGGVDIDPNLLDATDSGNYTTFGTETPASAIAGCTFSDCLSTHLFTEIFVSATDFHEKTTFPPSPSIDKGLASFIDGGKQWVPSVDYDGNVRPQGLGTDIGFDEAPGLVSPTPSNTPTTTPTPTNTTASTSTNTPTNTPTSTPTNTPTNTPSNTPSNTPTNTSTNTPTSTPTTTTTLPPTTNTPTSTPTNTSGSTVTNTPTNTPSNTPTNTGTSTPTSTPTNTLTATNTPTNTPSNIPTNTPTNTRTSTPTTTSTPGPSGIPLNIPTVSEWGLLAFGLLLAGLGYSILRAGSSRM